MNEFIKSLYSIVKLSFTNNKLYYKGRAKLKLIIFFDNLFWLFRENSANHMYYAFGMNLKNIDSTKFFGKQTFMRIKEERESSIKSKLGLSKLSYDVITKDKFYFNSILSANNIPCIKNEAIIRYNIIIQNGIEYPLSNISLLFHEDIVIKNVAIESGEGVFVLEYRNNIHYINEICFKDYIKKNNFTHGVWVIQKRLKSHSDIQRINSSALNTTRIVTCLGSNFKPKFIGGFQAFATNHATTDSWNHGSVYVGFNLEEECLTKDGLLSVEDKRGGIINRHPDSKIAFEGYHVPYLKESVELCIKAHKLLYTNYIIGWDVAITDDGPIIVEANEKPGMNVVQIFSDGLKNKILHKHE